MDRSLSDLVAQCVNGKVEQILKNILHIKQEIVVAFMAKYGCDPADIELCDQIQGTTHVTWVRKRVTQ